MASAEQLPAAASLVRWSDERGERSALWKPESGAAPPRRIVPADDALAADTAYRLACEGAGLLWRGDFQNARHLLDALARRADRPKKTKRDPKADAVARQPVFPDSFHLFRQAKAQRARILSMLLIEVAANRTIGLRRAPDWAAAMREAWGDEEPAGAGLPSTRVVPLRELLGIVGAHEWRKNGVEVPALGEPPGNRIHPHYGVFSPLRGEYLDLVAAAALPQSCDLAFDIGCGSGVIAAVLARRGVARVVATDHDPRALACAVDNIARLGLSAQVEVLQADLFVPQGRAALVVCNPPWLPARAASRLEATVYDEDSRMLRGFLQGLAAHLAPGGEGWLVLSDLAESLGLRTREQLLGWIEAAGLRVLGKSDVRPRHPKRLDARDPLHEARSREVTSLWRLGVPPDR